MIGRGILSVFFGLLLVPGLLELNAQPSADSPDFKEVYDLIRTNVAGISQAQLDHSAVQALVTALAPKVMLVGSGSDTNDDSGKFVTKVAIFSQDIGYFRVGRVESGLPEALHQSIKDLLSTNKLQGIVLDLRFADGRDFAAASGVADLFTSKERPLLDWGKGLQRSTGKSDAFMLPLVILVNHQTSGAAEALAAVLRDASAAVILGNRTAGQAMITQEFTLKNGQRLRIATAPIKLGSGATLSPEGLKPDIAVQVGPQEEREYMIDAFKNPQSTNFVISSANLSLTNQPGTTNRSRRSRFNEAELVRERREGANLDGELSLARGNEPEKPVVRDPALARGLDILKGLAVVRHSRS
jgi:hypothetical protein